MSKEIKQIGDINIGTGHGAFVKDNDNPWLAWLEENNINPESLEIKKITHAKPKQVRFGKIPKIPIENFIKSPWTLWYDERVSPSVEWTINKYKSIFKRSRPDWAKSFRERGIDKTDVKLSRYKHSFILAESYLENDYWFVERELYIPDLAKKRKTIIERIYDISGVFNNMTILCSKTSSALSIIRSESKVAPQRWQSTEWEYIDDFHGIRYPQLLKLPNPLQSYINL